jgi:hypothetical protein
MYISLLPWDRSKKKEKEVKTPFGIKGKGDMGWQDIELGLKYTSQRKEREANRGVSAWDELAV